MRRLGLALAVALAVLAGVLPASAADPVVVQPATFGWLPPGWRHFDGAPDLVGPAGASAESFATSWPYRLGNPLGPAGSLPRDAIFVNVLLLRRSPGRARVDLCHRTPHLRGFPLVRPPLRLPRATTDVLEGAPDVPEYRIFGRIDESYDVDLRVDVSRRRPTARQLALAQRVVAAIRFPRWPALRRC